ncbi:MAG TPA: hypothetical protein VG733_07680, partial [Chthoniobacteraceae bacterium]|nr:hypothetical protein [Chthoniobacteraceae bacterium]
MRAFVIVLNGVGAGAAPDAAKYGDDGANTLGRLYEHCAHLELPTLISMGLGEIVGATPDFVPSASRGRMRPRSKGKDTTTAHWELAGVVSQEAFTSYERFPDSLVREIETAAKVKFIGNDRRDIGTLPGALCNEHLKTGHPILEALPDSTMFIYAHEKVIPRARLYEIARIARKHCGTHRIHRVVAQPFTGETGTFSVSPYTREYPTVPPRTVLNAISETGLRV